MTLPQPYRRPIVANGVLIPSAFALNDICEAFIFALPAHCRKGQPHIDLSRGYNFDGRR
jgi:hypothetical protein